MTSRYTTRITQNKGGVFSDEFGLRSPVIQKAFHTKTASSTSIVALVQGSLHFFGSFFLQRLGVPRACDTPVPLRDFQALCGCGRNSQHELTNDGE